MFSRWIKICCNCCFTLKHLWRTHGGKAFPLQSDLRIYSYLNHCNSLALLWLHYWMKWLLTPHPLSTARVGFQTGFFPKLGVDSLLKCLVTNCVIRHCVQQGVCYFNQEDILSYLSKMLMRCVISFDFKHKSPPQKTTTKNKLLYFWTKAAKVCRILPWQ